MDTRPCAPHRDPVPSPFSKPRPSGVRALGCSHARAADFGGQFQRFFFAPCSPVAAFLRPVHLGSRAEEAQESERSKVAPQE